jgi:phenylacetate-CoA ligase
LKSLIRRLRGNVLVLSHLPAQRRIPRSPRVHVEALRDAGVRRIVRWAARTVPHYRDLFRRERIDPGGIRTAADLDRLPVLDKDAVRRDPLRFVSEWRGARDGITLLTSGSTGERVTIHHDRASLLANIAYSEREREVVTSFLGKKLGYREALLNYPGSTLDKVDDYYRRSTLIPGRPDRIRLSVLDPIEENAARIESFAPAVVFTYGSYLEALHRAATAGRIRMYRPRVIVYGAEAIFPQVRSEIEAAYGVPVLSVYNAVEVFKIAFQCERRSGFHVHEDLCHVRIVDADGRTARDGEKGEVVISNLVNRGTVLINYRLGDQSAYVDEPCACGRSLRTLGEIDGRTEDLLALANGRVIHPRAVWGIVKPRLEIRQYQLLQAAPERFVLRLVTADEAAFRAIAPQVADELGSLLGPGMQVALERRADIPRGPGGKVRLVVALGASAGGQ